MTRSAVAVAESVLVRNGITAVVAALADLNLVAVAVSGAEAATLIEGLRPDVVLVDYELADGPGLGFGAQIRRRYPAIGVVLLGPRDENLLLRALEAGLSAYLSRSASIPELLAVLRQAAASPRSFTAPDLADALSRRSRPTAFSRREREVLGYVAAGLSGRKIADTLSLSESTVKTYLSRVCEKLGVRTREHAVLAATQLGLLEQRVHDA